MKTGPEETQAETRVRSEPSLSPETSMFSEEQPTCECEFEGWFLLLAINLVSSFKPIVGLQVQTEIFFFWGRAEGGERSEQKRRRALGGVKSLIVEQVEKNSTRDFQSIKEWFQDPGKQEWSFRRQAQIHYAPTLTWWQRMGFCITEQATSIGLVRQKDVGWASLSREAFVFDVSRWIRPTGHRKFQNDGLGFFIGLPISSPHERDPGLNIASGRDSVVKIETHVVVSPTGRGIILKAGAQQAILKADPRVQHGRQLIPNYRQSSRQIQST